MHSWFPMYFPIKNPLIVTKGQTVSIEVWRNNSQSKVWYEWAMSVHEGARLVQRSHVHNANGKGFSIGL